MSNTYLVVIPTFNEVESVPILLQALSVLPNNFSFLVVDDGSPDGTAKVCNELRTQIPNLEILERARKSGLGSAYRAGYQYAIRKNFDAIIQIDADGSHQVSDLSKLLSNFESDPTLDLIVGSRWISGGSILNWSKHRQVLSRLANFYSNLILSLGVKDSTSGFRIYKTSVIKKLNLGCITSEGYCFQIEMTRKLRNLNAQVLEVPIIFIERKFGKSKLSLTIIMEAVIKVGYWGIQDNFKRHIK